MEMANFGTRVPKMATCHLCVATPFRPSIYLYTPNSREGPARLPTPHAYHDKQLGRYSIPLPFSRPPGWESSNLCDQATGPGVLGSPRRSNKFALGHVGDHDAGDISDADMSSALIERRGCACPPRRILGWFHPTSPDTPAAGHPISGPT